MEIYMNIMSLTAVELGKRIKAKEISVEEAVTAALDAIEKKEKLVNSFVTVDREGALKRAKEVQKQIDDGTLTGPLAGVPVAIKDNMCTKDLLTTCSSKILYNFIPTYTAEAVLNLEKAGAVILGKTNMDEFAMGSTTETSAYGETKNPWNTEHVPGGSSPTTSFDCSGLTQWCYEKAGISLPRTAQAQYDATQHLPLSQAKAGDLVFFHSTYNAGSYVTHVGILVSPTQMYHAGDPIGYADLSSSYWQQHLIGAGRVKQ